jgi:hypothetical protein
LSASVDRDEVDLDEVGRPALGHRALSSVNGGAALAPP